jgi:hypothetical protein
VAPFFAACGKYFPSTLRLHAFAESVLLVAAPHVRLISAFRQRKSPLKFSARSPHASTPGSRVTQQAISLRRKRPHTIRRIKHPHETSSLDDPTLYGQGIAAPGSGSV